MPPLFAFFLGFLMLYLLIVLYMQYKILQLIQEFIKDVKE